MITSAIARRYAKALVQIAVEEGRVEQLKDELSSFRTILAGSRELQAILESPAYRIETKRDILKEIVAKAGLSGTAANFLMLLLDRGRISALPQIIDSYGLQADEISGIVRPTVISALPLDDAQVAGIRDSLEKTTGKKVALTVKVDSSLIGGVITKIGDKLFDGSVRTQLSRIQDTLQKG